MTEPRSDWTTPDGWGPPGGSSGPSASIPTYADQPAAGQAPYGEGPYGRPPQGQAAYGQAPYGSPPPVQPGVVPLRPLGLGELLDGAVGIVRRYPRPALGLSALVALASTVLNILVALASFDQLRALDQAAVSGSQEEFEAAIGTVVTSGGASGVVSLLANVVLTGVVTAVVGKAVLGQPLSAGAAWREVRPRLLPLLGLALLVLLIATGWLTLLVTLGILLFLPGSVPLAVLGGLLCVIGVVGAVYLYVRLALAPSALVLEHAGVRTSLKRSGVLVKGDWWRIFGILLLTAIIGAFVSAIIQLPFQAPSFVGGLGGEQLSAGELILSSVGSGIALTLVAPFTTGVAALLYVDRRIRAEGLDVALAASAAQARPAAPGA